MRVKNQLMAKPSLAERYIAFTQQRVTETIRDVFMGLERKESAMDEQLIEIARELDQPVPDMNELLFEDALALLIRNFSAEHMEKARANVRVIQKEADADNKLKGLDPYWKYQFYWKNRTYVYSPCESRVDPNETDPDIIWLFSLDGDADINDNKIRAEIETVQMILSRCPETLELFSKHMKSGKFRLRYDANRDFLKQLILNEKHKAIWDHINEVQKMFCGSFSHNRGLPKSAAKKRRVK